MQIKDFATRESPLSLGNILKKLGSGVFSHVYDWNSHAVAKFTRCEASSFWLSKLLHARRVNRFFPSVLFTPDEALFIVERLYRTPREVQKAQQARRNRASYTLKKPSYALERLEASSIQPIDRALFATLGNIVHPANLAMYCSLPGAQVALAQLCLWAEEYDATHSTVMRVDLHADNVMLDMFGHWVFSDPVVTRGRTEFEEYVTPTACAYSRVETRSDGLFDMWPAVLPLRTAASRKLAVNLERQGLAKVFPVGKNLWTHIVRQKPRKISRIDPQVFQASRALCAEHLLALDRFVASA